MFTQIYAGTGIAQSIVTRLQVGPPGIRRLFPDRHGDTFYSFPRHPASYHLAPGAVSRG
jgi:hypothetical protein